MQSFAFMRGRTHEAAFVIADEVRARVTLTLTLTLALTMTR